MTVCMQHQVSIQAPVLFLVVEVSPELLRLIVWLLTGVRLAVQGLGFGLVRAKTLEYRVSTRAVAQGRHGLKTVESIGLNV